MVSIFLINNKQTVDIESGKTVNDLIKEDSFLRENIVAAIVNDVLVDADFNLVEDGNVKIIVPGSKEAFKVLNHSAAHLLAAAVNRVFGKSKFGYGPATEEGFYYDVKTNTSINDVSLQKIQNEMFNIANDNLTNIHKVVSKKEALDIFKYDEFKCEIINSKDDSETLTIYSMGNEYTDLCKGPHLPNTKFLKHFVLLSLGGVYWKNNSNNQIMTRVYGTAHFTSKELRKYLEVLKLRKERDHRKIGSKMKIFAFDSEFASGLPIWLKNGTRMIRKMSEYIHLVENRLDFQHVITPILGNEKLYETSGHLRHYKNDMFQPIKTDHEKYILRPMSCPHHCRIYSMEPRSYRDLPIKYAEEAILHRYEASGALSGLERVRMMTLTDAHLFARKDQVKYLVTECIQSIIEVLKSFQLEINYFRLSLGDRNDTESFFKNDKAWDETEQILEQVLIENEYKYVKEKGEAAFYGPKIDIQLETILKHDITISTIQLDFSTPKNFNLTYRDKKNELQQPVIIHRGLIGTYERFIAALLEQTNGNLPFWISPVQVGIISVDFKSEMQKKYCEIIKRELIDNDIAVYFDNSDSRLGQKIRNAQVSKVSYQLIIGDAECEEKMITYRKKGQKESFKVSLKQFLKKIQKEIKDRT